MHFTNAKNLAALEDINNLLEYANKGFYFFTTDTVSMQGEVAKNINSKNISVLDYSKNTKPYSYHDLLELIEKNPEDSKFIVLNFQLALQEKNDILNLNLSRDALAKQEKLWIFGMTEDMEDRLAKTAFDFYSYVMMKIRFKDENKLEENEIQDKELVRYLIENYEEILNTSKVKSPEFLAMTYYRLSNLYKNIADHQKALDYCDKALRLDVKT